MQPAHLRNGPSIKRRRPQNDGDKKAGESFSQAFRVSASNQELSDSRRGMSGASGRLLQLRTTLDPCFRFSGTRVLT